MAKVIHLKLTGKAESFIEDMKKQGLNEQDVFAKALNVLEDIWKTKRVALIKETHLTEVDGIEYFYGINIHQDKTSAFRVESSENVTLPTIHPTSGESRTGV